MKKLPDQFQQSRIDLEIDLEGSGGPQRFKTVGEFEAWLREETEFWDWMNQAPASNHHSHVSELIQRFFKLRDECRAQLNATGSSWKRLHNEIQQWESSLTDDGRSEESKKATQESIERGLKAIEREIEQLRSAITTIVKREIVKTKDYLPRSNPGAQFVKELAETKPDEAIYALDQLMLDERNASDPRQVGHTGRMMAALYRKNLNRKIRHDKQAFDNAITTWANELADFKSRYEGQVKAFAAISKRHLDADEAWRKKADELAGAFDEMRSSKEHDLKNLTDTYEAHMQLKGPLVYWRGKRREHTIAKKRMGWAAGTAGVLGAALIGASAHLFLPESTSPDSIPWRSIGLFLLISTLVLWLVRLLVKLLLSHVHLCADAREREVMISTFMALMRRQESREGVEQMDLALVLAPIFKPSTTGVIKDDGGPTTLADFVSRLAGKP